MEDAKVIIGLERFNKLLASYKVQEEQRELNKKIFAKHLTKLIPVMNRISSHVTIDWESLDLNQDPTKVVLDGASNSLKFLYSPDQPHGL